MRPRIDSRLEEDVNRLMCCAPIDCHREHSCYRVAKFARDQLRNLHAIAEPLTQEEVEEVEQYVITCLYANTGSWEAA